MSSFGFAKEYAINRSEVPEAVLKVATEKYPHAQMNRFVREIDHKRTLYEVQLDLGRARAELIVTPAGAIQSEELAIALADAPASVQRGLAASRFGKSKVLRVEKVTRAERARKPTYEIVVDLGGKKHELTFDANGRLVTSERTEEED